MSILLLGGRGKTSIRIAGLLDKVKVPFFLASRSQSSECPFPQVKFDWFEDGSWDSVFDTAEPPITAAYLVAPEVLDPFSCMKAFIDRARQHGVKRFVQLSGSPIEAGGPLYGKVHQHLMECGAEWTVLRPTWFMENLSESTHRLTIKDHSKIYSSTQTGKIPWISVEDIAAVAFRSLTDKTAHNADHLILGPELLSYNDVADILSDVLGREITHIKLTVPEHREHLISQGMPVEHAEMLSTLDGNIAKGSEERLNNTVEEVTGRPPMAFRAFAEKVKTVW